MSLNCDNFKCVEFVERKLIAEEVLQKSFAECGENVKVFSGCRIFPVDCVSIGRCSQIDEGVQIFSGKGVELGCYVHLAFSSSISGGGRCKIEDFSSIGAGVRILTGSDIPNDGFLNNPTIPDKYRSYIRSETLIERSAIIYTNSIVFPGVTIGEGAVVGAGSLVHRNLNPWTIYSGNPLVAIKQRNREKCQEVMKNLSKE